MLLEVAHQLLDSRFDEANTEAYEKARRAWQEAYQMAIDAKDAQETVKTLTDFFVKKHDEADELIGKMLE
jgi:hypothetical protein